MSDETVAISLPVRLQLARAAVQVLADDTGVRLLHIKGNAADASLRDGAASGTDIDVMIHPDDIRRFDAVLTAHGWQRYSSFANGSPFEHAQTYWSDTWGHLDLHRRFPGIRRKDAEAFAILARDGGEADVAGTACPVPSVPAQGVVLILNAARAGGIEGSPLERVWNAAPTRWRTEVEALVAELDAPVGFAVAFGRLDEWQGERDYDLWRVVTHGGTRVEEWRARMRAAPTRWAALRIALRAAFVNVDVLRHDLGRDPRAIDIVRSFGARAFHAASDIVGRTKR